MTEEDRAKHKKIADAIIEEFEESIKNKKESELASFYNQKAKELEVKYQPHLNNGINLNIIVNPKGDDDITSFGFNVKVEIKPNDTYKEETLILFGQFTSEKSTFSGNKGLEKNLMTPTLETPSSKSLAMSNVLEQAPLAAAFLVGNIGDYSFGDRYTVDQLAIAGNQAYVSSVQSNIHVELDF